MNAGAKSSSALDSPLARLLAGGVLAGVVAILLAIHWGDLFPPEVAAKAAGDDPVALCVAQRSAEIEQMITDNPSMAARRNLFIERVAAMCQATAGGGNALPPPPSLVPRD